MDSACTPPRGVSGCLDRARPDQPGTSPRQRGLTDSHFTARLRSTEGAATSYCQPSHRFSDAEVEDLGRRNQLRVRGERPDPASDSDDHYPVSRRVLEHDRRPFAVSYTHLTLPT